MSFLHRARQEVEDQCAIHSRLKILFYLFPEQTSAPDRIKVSGLQNIRHL